MNNNLKKYREELNKELKDFLEKVDKLPRDNPESEKENEWKFSKETRKKIDEEIKDIYQRLRKKYNIQ